MFVRPVIAATAALSCLLVSFFVVTSHPQRAFGILVRAALAVGAAVLAILLLGPVTNSQLPWWFTAFPDMGAADPPVSVSEFIARQNTAAVGVMMPLAGIAIAFAVIAALSRSAPLPATTLDDETTAADRIIGPPSSEDERLRNAPPQPPSAAAQAFNDLSYRVRPHQQLLLGLRRSNRDYEIRGTSPAGSSRERFSYSMRTGLLQREVDDAVIFSISRRADSLTETLDVVDSETGRPVGSFRSRANGWDIDDALGRPVLFVVRDLEEERRMRYIASVGGNEVCRYTWSFGLVLFNLALEIDFAPGGPAFDRALAVALGPFIEEEARLLSERMRCWD